MKSKEMKSRYSLKLEFEVDHKLTTTESGGIYATLENALIELVVADIITEVYDVNLMKRMRKTGKWGGR